MDKLLIVISGPSGVGKGTAVKEFVKNPQYALSISCTTRKPREGEEDGKDYFFITDDEFEKMIENDSFIEHAGYCEHYYGTPKDYVFSKMEENRDVVLEIEVQGALQVKERYPDSVLVFLLPPSMEELKRRLKGRGTESDDVIEQRMERAREELAFFDKYDYTVINDNIENVLRQIEEIVSAERKKCSKNADVVKKLLKGEDII